MDNLKVKNNNKGFRYVFDGVKWDKWYEIIHKQLEAHDNWCEGVCEQLIGGINDSYRLYNIRLSWTEYGLKKSVHFDYLLIIDNGAYTPPTAYGIKIRGLRQDEFNLLLDFEEEYQEQQDELIAEEEAYFQEQTA